MLNSRLTRRSLIAVAVLLSMLLGFVVLFWGLGQPRVFTWVAQKAATLSGGRLMLNGVAGDLWNHISIAKLYYEDDQRIIKVRALSLDWRGRALLERHLRVIRLRWQDARYESKSADTPPPTLPASLRLPFNVSVDSIEGPLTFVTAGIPLRFDAIVLGLDQRGELYQLRVERVETPFGTLAGNVNLAADSPFDLAGRLSIKGERTDIRNGGGFEIGGTLEQIRVSGMLTAERQQITASAIVKPFSAIALRHFEAKALGFDPSIWRKSWPKAAIDLQSAATFAEHGKAEAAFRLLNRAPGRIDEARLPLREATGFASGSIAAGSFREVVVDLGKAGALTGSGGWADGSWRLALNTSRLNAKALHQQLIPTRLAGSLVVSGDKQAQHLVAKLAQADYALALEGAKRGDQLEIPNATLLAKTARLQASGRLGLVGRRSFSLETRLAHFNPRRFGDFPQADINADINTHGTLADGSDARVRLKILKSTLRGYPLSGSADIAVAGSRIGNSVIDLILAGNKMRARGSMGGRDDRLRFDIDAPQLGRLGRNFAGTLKAKGVLAGEWQEPSVQASVEARGLRATRAYRADRLSAEVDLAFQPNAPFAVTANARGLKANDFEFDTLRIRSTGRTQSHRIEAALNGPQRAVTFAANGGWRKPTGWTGEIQRLTSTKPLGIEMTAPATLQIAPGQGTLRGAALRVGQGTLVLKTVAWREGLLRTEGRASALSIEALLAALRQSPPAQFALLVDADWDLELGDEINGSLHASRRSGDVILKQPRVLALKLNRLDLRAEARGGLISAKIDVAGEQVGRVAGNLTTRVRRQHGRWGMPGGAPLAGALRAQSDSIAWLSAFAKDALAVDGALNGSLKIGGTLSKPLLRGTVLGSQLKIVMPDYGINLDDGRLVADFVGDEMHIRQLAFSAGSGTLTASGRLGIANDRPDAMLRWAADSLEALASPDRQLVVSGDGSVRVVDKQIIVIGSLKADRGIIELPDADVVKLSPDIVIVGRTKEKKAKALPYAVRMELSVDLGERFVAKGRGLDAKLTGQVRITAAGGGMPRAVGTIRIEKGSYTVYGRTLELERGTINFAGPIDNPAIHVIARRRTAQVEAGVEVTGTLDNPIVRLVSKPPMQDAEILSWLVLGRSLGDSAGSELGLLQAAAGALLARGQSTTLQAKLAAATGLDEISIGTSGSDFAGAVVTLGKQLSERLYLTYEQGLATSGSLLSLRYQLSDRLSLRSQGGSQNALDLFYSFSYD